MHHNLDAFAYTNNLRRLFPQQKLLFALVVLSIALITHPLTQLLIVVWLSVWIIGYAGIPSKVYGRLFTLAAVFLLMSLPALVLNIVSIDQAAQVQVDQVAGVSLGGWYGFVSRSGVRQALEVGMRSLSCVSCLLFVLLTIPFTELLQVLRQLRVPTILTDLLLLMYRFIFLFLEVAAELQLAQRARGGYRTRKRWMQSMGLLVGQLVVRSLQRYQQFSLGLATRGFNGELQVYSNRSYLYSKRYALESLLGCTGLVIFEVLTVGNW